MKNKEVIFRFYGRAGDLPFALLKHLNMQFAEQNRAIQAVLDKTVPFWKSLLWASQFDALDERRRIAMRNLIRPKI